MKLLDKYRWYAPFTRSRVGPAINGEITTGNHDGTLLATEPTIMI